MFVTECDLLYVVQRLLNGGRAGLARHLLIDGNLDEYLDPVVLEELIENKDNDKAVIKKANVLLADLKAMLARVNAELASDIDDDELDGE